VAPFTKAVPLNVTLTVELAGAVFGVTLSTFKGTTVDVTVIVGRDGTVAVEVKVGRFAVGVTCVLVGSGVNVTIVAVGRMGVKVHVGVARGAVGDIASVGEGIGEAVGVITIGLPNSRQPRSGALPM
jgi:hypothetical protein